MRPVTIYTISDRATNRVLYVGATVLPLRLRLKGHLSSRTLPLAKDASVVPVIEELEVVSGEAEAVTAERYWIQQMKAWGFVLQNSKKNFRYKNTHRPYTY